jgi:hypothetical protein
LLVLFYFLYYVPYPSWSFHLLLGRPMFLLTFGLQCSACFCSLFLSILCTCCSQFCWYSFISFTMFCAPVGPSISSSVLLCSFFLLVYNAVPVLVDYLCPYSVGVVATFAGTILFPLVCSVSQLVPPSPPRSSYVPSSFWSIIQCLFR